jgi:hypothetical protein
MTTLYDIAKDVSKLLNDSQHCDGEYDFTRWSQHELATYGKMGMAMLFSLVPKKFTNLVQIELKPGSVQNLPEGCTKIVKLLNMNGIDATSSIAKHTDDRITSLFSNNCGAVSYFNGLYEVKSYSLEETSDNVFYVTPPVPHSEDKLVVNAICYQMKDINLKETNIEPWAWNAIIEWMLYRAYQSEDESSNSLTQMETHLKNFYTMVELLNRTEKTLLPNSSPIMRSGNESA